MIRVFEDDYNREDFYKMMGCYFAEPSHKRKMPYLTNRENTVWYVLLEDDMVKAFSAYEEGRKRIDFKTDYTPGKIEDLEKVIDQKMLALADTVKPIYTAVLKDKTELLAIYQSYGFKKYKNSKKYIFMMKEAKDAKCG